MDSQIADHVMTVYSWQTSRHYYYCNYCDGGGDGLYYGVIIDWLLRSAGKVMLTGYMGIGLAVDVVDVVVVAGGGGGGGGWILMMMAAYWCYCWDYYYYYSGGNMSCYVR